MIVAIVDTRRPPPPLRIRLLPAAAARSAAYDIASTANAAIRPNSRDVTRRVPTAPVATAVHSHHDRPTTAPRVANSSPAARVVGWSKA